MKQRQNVGSSTGMQWPLEFDFLALILARFWSSQLMFSRSELSQRKATSQDPFPTGSSPLFWGRERVELCGCKPSSAHLPWGKPMDPGLKLWFGLPLLMQALKIVFANYTGEKKKKSLVKQVFRKCPTAAPV